MRREENRVETNIQLLHSARRALESIQVASGESRDATIRWLVEEYVRSQEERDPARWLSHISTVLRYPLPPVDRREAYPAAPVRVRISSQLAERARAVSLRLPGQPPYRGGRDYQARPLTDAVVTAIARREPIHDPFLDGLMPLLRHRAADGLWRLTVAATATRTETELFTRTGNPFATRDRVAQELLFNQVAWHGEWRLDVLRTLARHYLTGPNAVAAERMLFEQGNEFEFAWTELLNRTGLEDDGTGGLPQPHSDYEGRAGGAVWRAERATEKVNLVDWLAGHDGGAVRHIAPPGWGLQVPRGWVGTVCRTGSPDLEQMHPWVEQRQVLQLPMGTLASSLPVGSRVLVWPLHVTESGARSPVPGLEVVLEQLGRMPAAAAAELILRDHRHPAYEDDPDSNLGDAPEPDSADDLDLDDELDDELEEDEKVFWGALEVPAYVARRLGLVDEATFSQLLHDAESDTRLRMAELLSVLPPELVDEELRGATSCPALFIELLDRRGVGGDFREKKPRWRWAVTSLADQIVKGSSHEVLMWLTEQLRWRYDHELWSSEYEAWKAASARYNW